MEDGHAGLDVDHCTRSTRERTNFQRRFRRELGPVGRAFLRCDEEVPMRRLLLRNRRTSLRHSVDIPCQIVRERDFKLIADRIVNLSHSGMLTLPAERVLTGERLIASFRVPNSNYWIDVDVTVTRVVHGRRRGEHARAIGLEFENLGGLAQLVLQSALQALPPAPPSARPGRRSTARAMRALLGWPAPLAKAS